MVWRWSRLNNFKINENLPFILRFNSIKLLKAVNYRRFVIGTTKFKRIKFAKWKRNSSWLPYVAIFKFWIKDYTNWKKITKSQYVNTVSPHSYAIHDYFYIKKKNILNTAFDRIFLICNISRFLIKYTYKKYNTNAIFFFLSSFVNNNLVISFFFDDELNFGNKAEPLAFKNENLLFSFDVNIKKIKFFKIHETLIFFKIFCVYKLFGLLTYVKLFCLLNFLN